MVSVDGEEEKVGQKSVYTEKNAKGRRNKLRGGNGEGEGGFGDFLVTSVPVRGCVCVSFLLGFKGRQKTSGHVTE